MTSNLRAAQQAHREAQRALIIARADRAMAARVSTEPQPETLDSVCARAARHPEVDALLDAGKYADALERALAEIDHATIDRAVEPWARFDGARERLADEPRVERDGGRWVARTARRDLCAPTPIRDLAEAVAIEHELTRPQDPRIEDLDRLDVSGSVDALISIASTIVRDRFEGAFLASRSGTPIPQHLRGAIETRLGAGESVRWARGAGREAVPVLAGALRELASHRAEAAEARERLARAKRALAARDEAVRAELTREPTEAELERLNGVETIDD